jgi:hypothetical protein
MLKVASRKRLESKKKLFLKLLIDGVNTGDPCSKKDKMDKTGEFVDQIHTCLTMSYKG